MYDLRWLREEKLQVGPGDAGTPRAPSRPIARVDEVKDYSPAKTAVCVCFLSLKTFDS